MWHHSVKEEIISLYLYVEIDGQSGTSLATTLATIAQAQINGAAIRHSL